MGRFGQYQQLIEIKEIGTTSDSAGGLEESTITASVEVWGTLKPMVGRLALEYYQIVKNTPYIFEMRYHEEFSEQGFSSNLLKTKKYLVYRDREFAIHSVINVDEKNRFIKGICYER